MEAGHEREIVAQLKSAAEAALPSPLELVVFDGTVAGTHSGETMSIRQQADLFREAAVVVGPHGGALANLLWLPQQRTLAKADGSCKHRPAVLEFVCGNRSRSVQDGCPYLPSYWWSPPHWP